MKRAARANCSLFVCACAFVLGCDPGQPFEEVGPTALESHPGNERHISCGPNSTDGRGEGETYSLLLMNLKLQSYPEFARAIGMNRVTTCDEARYYMEAYNRYLVKHPSFDDQLPSKEERSRRWIEESRQGTGQRTK